MLSLRQVDDFAVASADNNTNREIIKAIDKEFGTKIKDLGRLNRYNGVDVSQTGDYIKLSKETYIEKVMKGHPWLAKDQHIASVPIPMKSENDYIRMLENATPPTTEKERQQLQVDMGLNYRQAVGALIYLMVTCRPNISYPLIKLSQYNTKPAKEHYEAIKHTFKYVRATISDGLYYWRKDKRQDLPKGPDPTTKPSNYDNSITTRGNNTTQLHAAIDSDWGGSTRNRKSVTCMIIRIAGGTVVYETKYQDAVSLS